jgi:Leucine-rich repeat (LRR) protein
MEVSQLHDLDAEFDKLISITEHEISKTINAAELVKGGATATIATYMPSVEKPPPNIALPIPPPISPYLSLTFLDVSNSSDNFPEWLPECTNLTHLIAANHHLTAIPSFITEKLTKLQVIDLSWNQLNEWPIQFAKLPDLQVLNLEGNPFFVRLIENNPRFWIEYSKSTSGENINGNDVARTHTTGINPTMSKKTFTSETKKKSSWFSRRKSVAIREAQEQEPESDEDEGVLTSLDPVSSLSCTTTDSSSTTSSTAKPKYKVSKILQHKSSVLISLLRDVYELVTKEPPAQPVKSDATSVDVMSSKMSVHSSSSSSTSASLATLTTAINTAIEEEKTYVTKLTEFSTVYLNSKKIPIAKNEHLKSLLAPFPVFQQFHSSVMLGGLQRFKMNQNYAQLAQAVAAHIDIFRLYYYGYVIELEKRHDLVAFLKRVSDMETSNSDMNGSSMGQIARSKWYKEADWVQHCVRNKQHSLQGINDYLQLPVVQLKRYRVLFLRLAKLEHTLAEGHAPTQESKLLAGINEQLDKVFKEIEHKKPLILQKRRLADFDRAFNLRAKIPENQDRLYLGDASILLQREVTLLGGMNVEYTVHKSKFNLMLYRVIVCDDVVAVVDEDKRKVVKMAIKNKVRITQHGQAVRIVFSASCVWHGALRAFYGDFFKPKP